MCETFGKVLLPDFSMVIIFLVVAVVLLWRPQGLLGGVYVRR
jgi:branched-chain amino acid transport system permease protein